MHRIGRTARAGASGNALSFCDPTEKSYLRDILTHLGEEPAVVEEHPFHSEHTMNYSGRVQSKNSPERLTVKHTKGKEKTWRLAPGEQDKVHAKSGGPEKNARRNPKKRKEGL